MNAITENSTIEEILVARPFSSSLFERMNIDYCCGGKVTLASACASCGVRVVDLLRILNAGIEFGGQTDQTKEVNLDEVQSVSMLVDFIEATHHAFLWEEMGNTKKLMAQVAVVHGGRDVRLVEVREIFMELAAELTSHMLKEEQVLFPLIRRIDELEAPFLSGCGSVVNPIRIMDADHDKALAAFIQLRRLTDDYIPPPTACFSYRSMLAGLERIERDLREHIRKESELLFPKIVQLEKEKFPNMACLGHNQA